MRASVFNLRRPGVAAGLKGVAWGLLLPGPLAAVVFVCLFFGLPPGCLFFAGESGVTEPIEAAVSTPELASGLAEAIRGDAVLLIGSSEMHTIGPEARAGRSLHEHLLECRASRRFVSVSPRGSAVFRTAMLLERLQRHFKTSRTPVHIIVLDNSHYATAAIQNWSDLRGEFPGDASLVLHFARFPNSLFAQLPGYQKQIQAARSRLSRSGVPTAILPLELQVFRSFLGRRLVAPVRRSLRETKLEDGGGQGLAPSGLSIEIARNATWGVAAQFVPKNNGISEFRARKSLSASLPESVYGRSVAILAQAAKLWLPAGSRLDYILLPIQRKYYDQLGLNGRALDQRRLTFVREYFPEAAFAESMKTADLFYDSIHYTDEGRGRLAAKICERF